MTDTYEEIAAMVQGVHRQDRTGAAALQLLKRVRRAIERDSMNPHTWYTAACLYSEPGTEYFNALKSEYCYQKVLEIENATGVSGASE